MQERSMLHGAFGKAAGFFYAVVASVVANLVFVYMLPHGTAMEKAAAAPREAAVAAPLPPAPPAPVQPVAPPPAVQAAAAPPPALQAAAAAPPAVQAAAPPPATETASAAPPWSSRPGPGSGGLY
ncbi:MAG TPA: hypothetical protein VM755_03265 [Stellaceae bacterium]|nr:hypothetical protein [Stellaceae bacterium]